MRIVVDFCRPQLEVDFATGRDLKAGQLQEMTNTITTW